VASARPWGVKYIEPEPHREGGRERTKAKEYVFCQVVCITQSWLKGKELCATSQSPPKKPRGRAGPTPGESTAEDLLEGSDIFREWEGSHKVCDQAFLEEVLDRVGREF
jgi:hypothetical protein